MDTYRLRLHPDDVAVVTECAVTDLPAVIVYSEPLSGGLRQMSVRPVAHGGLWEVVLLQLRSQTPHVPALIHDVVTEFNRDIQRGWELLLEEAGG